MDEGNGWGFRVKSPQVLYNRGELYNISVARGTLSEEERYLADQRGLGREWTDIAADRGQSPEALRKRLSRAIDRVARQLGLDEVSHE